MVSALMTFALFGTASSSLAARVSFTGVHATHIAEHFPELMSRPAVHRRDGNGGGNVTLVDQKDAMYFVNLTLNGAQFTVSIDTGSSDLWIASALDNATDTGESGTVSYARGSATGPIKRADLEWAGLNVKDQVFMAATSVEDTGSNFGIIGLGPNSGSVWFDKLDQQASADTALTRIFAANASSEMFITSTLGRSADDPTMPYPGQLTIDEVLPGYEAVQQQPKLALTTASLAENQHWQTLLDADGFLVNGKPVAHPDTVVATTPNAQQLTVVFDNGFTLPQLPRAMVDAIYQGVQGAQFSAPDNLYILPCNAELDVAFKFQGVVYPVHPLDTVSKAIANDPRKGCVGAFQPMTFDSGNILDVILGMGFLRNVYMLNSFGTLVRANASAPYVQLLNLNNDTTAMHNEFIKVRSGAGRTSTAAVAAAVLASVVAFLLV